MKPKKPKIRPFRGWAEAYEGVGIIPTTVCDEAYSGYIPVVILPLADYRSLVKNQRKAK